MKEYHAIQTGTWLPRDDVDPLTAVYYGFTMPKPWRETVQRVVDLSKGRPDSYIPLGRLNQVVEATAPDFVHAISEPRELDQPWLYAERPMSTSMMRKLLKAWLIDILGDRGDQRQALAALREIDFNGQDELWKYGVVNLWESDDPSKGGTARPKRELFRLLPDVIAGEIERLGPYEHLGTKVHFRQVACSSGAQLMAFPPLRHQDRRTKQHWYFSPFIHVSLHTVPFSPVPRVHLHLGMRRWVRWLPAGEGKQAPLRLPRKNGIGVYLRLESPWAELETPPRRIARAMAERKEGGFRWSTGGAGNMLARLGEFGDFPDLDELMRDTHKFIGNDEAGTWAALTHHTNLSTFHRVDPGFSPTEHMRVLEWAGQALERHYRIAPRMDKCSHRSGKPQHAIKKPRSNARPEDKEKIRRQGFEAYRALIRKGVGEELHATLLYQETDGEIREAIVAAACAEIGADVPEAAYDADTKRYVYRIEADNLRVVFTAHPIADLGRPLFPPDEKSKGGKAHEEAERERAEELKQYLTNLGVTGELLFVELPGADGFQAPTGRKDPMRDPKFALRRGAAMAGKVTQFVTPRKTVKNKPEEGKYLQARANSTWEDGLRQLGIRFVPQHSVGEAVPERLNYLGVWAIQKNWTQRNRRGMFEPVAVLVSPGEPRILARTFDTPGWIPYPEMLKQFALAEESSKELKSDPAKREHFAKFMRGTLRSPAVRRFPTVLFASALNSRRSDRWDWLQDAKVEPDTIRLGEGPVQRLDLHGKGLRLVRVRKEGGRRETPQWWAPDHEPERAPHLREAGQTVGLWHLPGDPSRVYYSTAEKNARIVGGLNRNLAKLTDWQRTYEPGKESKPQSPQPDHPYPMPDLLEIAVLGLQEGDEPRDWAYLTHQLRFPDEYTEGLALPLPLKLAEDIGKYAYPDAAERDPQIEDLEIEEPQQPKLFGFNDLVDD